MENANKRALIAGATSSLAYAICRKLAADGYGLVLLGRNREELDLLSGDLKIRYDIEVDIIEADLLSPSFNTEKIVKKSLPCGLAIILAGDMGGEDFDDIENLHNTTMVNYVKPASVVTEMAKAMQDNIEGGVIACISSVAGDRGRKKNYIYGSAKAAFTTFCSGMRNRYADSNVHIMTVKPGFVDTPMTYPMQSGLVADRQKVADYIIKAANKRKDVVYVPFFWRYIMLIITHIPEKIFKKLDL